MYFNMKSIKEPPQQLMPRMMEQADECMLPRPKGRKKSLTSRAYQDKDDYSDNGGEESLCLEGAVKTPCRPC